MSGQMASVRRCYDVPAERGREVLWLGGRFPVAVRITSSTGSHLYVRDANGRRIGPLHVAHARSIGVGWPVRSPRL